MVFSFDRFLFFLPQIILFAVVAISSFLVIRLYQFLYKEKLNDSEWTKENKWKMSFLIFSARTIYSLALVVLIFTVLLVVIFPNISKDVWPALIGSSLVFGLIHVKKNLKEKPHIAIRWKICGFVSNTLIGLVLGYVAIKYQSIMFPFYIYAIFNFCISLGLFHVTSIMIGVSVIVVCSIVINVWKKFSRSRVYCGKYRGVLKKNRQLKSE